MNRTGLIVTGAAPNSSGLVEVNYRWSALLTRGGENADADQMLSTKDSSADKQR